ncbi:MAG: carboxypeptidase-like regulatory domain-containing protein [Candidatus Methylacidiphilales bacterium]|nr:carboxypeptidase-like regulatory domain-containing protein [Candidatus Methylacidiphilales bacterium]
MKSMAATLVLLPTLMLSPVPLRAADKKAPATTPPTAPATLEATLSGTATIELRSDVKQYLAGLELVLVPEPAAAEIKKVREERWRERASRFRFNDGFNNLDLQAIGVEAIRHEIARATVDASGKYQFKALKPGSYRIYGQYKSHYAAGYWLIPVVIKKAGEAVTLDIHNGNFAEVYNYQK